VIQTLINSFYDQPFTTTHLFEQIRFQYDLSKLERNGIPRSGFGSIVWVFEGEKTIEEVRQFQIARDYPGNAPVMRAIPIGFIEDKLIEPYAIINADVTHPHPKARAASIIVARAARYLLIEKGSTEGLIEYCRSFIKDIDQETYFYLGTIDQLDSNVDQLTDGFVSNDYQLLVGPQPITSFMDLQPIVGLNSDAMRTAGTVLYLLKHCKTSLEALKRSMLIGGDVDSLAAIVVGIMAGKAGLEDIPPYMFENLEGVEYLKKNAHSFADALLP
jgi:ADP-ribosylglycohydrolase